MTRLLPVLILIVLARHAKPQAPPSAGQAPNAYRISVSVDLVVLNATVQDRKGRLVSDLRQQNFEVYEDGVRQSIRLFRQEDSPVTVGLVVDHSGSMRRKVSHVILAARTFTQSSNPEDEMFVVNFNENVSLGLPAAIPFTNRSDALELAISAAPTTGLTALYDAVNAALERLRAGNHDRKALIVISDGGDNASVGSMDEVLKNAVQSSTVVYTIGIFDAEDPDRNPRVLRRFARETGGEAFFPKALETLPSVCERIARLIRSQYTLGYVSTNTSQPGVYRTVRVAAAIAGSGKLSVRTRGGYIALGEPRAAQHDK